MNLQLLKLAVKKYELGQDEEKDRARQKREREKIANEELAKWEPKRKKKAEQVIKEKKQWAKERASLRDAKEIWEREQGEEVDQGKRGREPETIAKEEEGAAISSGDRPGPAIGLAKPCSRVREAIDRVPFMEEVGRLIESRTCLNLIDSLTFLKRKLDTLSSSEMVLEDSLPTGMKGFKLEEEYVPGSASSSSAVTHCGQSPLMDLTALDEEMDLTALGNERRIRLESILDDLSHSMSRLTAVDPERYLTDLENMEFVRAVETSKVKQDRILLRSMIRANPKIALAWIAVARLEEGTGNIGTAKDLIQRGCDVCLENEDVWLEAYRLASPEDAKGVIARGVKAIPTSVQLWMQAAGSEQEDVAQLRVLQLALEHIRGSVKLSTAVMKLAREDATRVVLSEAVEPGPPDTDIYLALPDLEPDENLRLPEWCWESIDPVKLEISGKSDRMITMYEEFYWLEEVTQSSTVWREASALQPLKIPNCERLSTLSESVGQLQAPTSQFTSLWILDSPVSRSLCSSGKLSGVKIWELFQKL